MLAAVRYGGAAAEIRLFAGEARWAGAVRAGLGGRADSRGPGMPPTAVAGSTVTASWMLRPNSRDSAWVISARRRVSSCSLTNSFGVAISAVFSTRPSGLVSRSQAR